MPLTPRDRTSGAREWNVVSDEIRGRAGFSPPRPCIVGFCTAPEAGNPFSSHHPIMEPLEAHSPVSSLPFAQTLHVTFPWSGPPFPHPVSGQRLKWSTDDWLPGLGLEGGGGRGKRRGGCGYKGTAEGSPVRMELCVSRLVVDTRTYAGDKIV